MVRKSEFVAKTQFLGTKFNVLNISFSPSYNILNWLKGLYANLLVRQFDLGAPAVFIQRISKRLANIFGAFSKFKTFLFPEEFFNKRTIIENYSNVSFEISDYCSWLRFHFWNFLDNFNLDPCFFTEPLIQFMET